MSAYIMQMLRKYLSVVFHEIFLKYVAERLPLMQYTSIFLVKEDKIFRERKWQKYVGNSIKSDL